MERKPQNLDTFIWIHPGEMFLLDLISEMKANYVKEIDQIVKKIFKICLDLIKGLVKR
jgi:hypothetical protein